MDDALLYCCLLSCLVLPDSWLRLARRAAQSAKKSRMTEMWEVASRS